MFEAKCYETKMVDEGDDGEVAKDNEKRGVEWLIITAYN
jgi:hypothetical protein